MNEGEVGVDRVDTEEWVVTVNNFPIGEPMEYDHACKAAGWLRSLGERCRLDLLDSYLEHCQEVV